jgi:hypothetical protein
MEQAVHNSKTAKNIHCINKQHHSKGICSENQWTVGQWCAIDTVGINARLWGPWHAKRAEQWQSSDSAAIARIIILKKKQHIYRNYMNEEYRTFFLKWQTKLKKTYQYIKDRISSELCFQNKQKKQ